MLRYICSHPSFNHPGHAAVGQTITLTGTGFGCLRRQAGVSFNGTPTVDPAFTDAAITVEVSNGATSGLVVVYDWEGNASGGQAFVVDP